MTNKTFKEEVIEEWFISQKDGYYKLSELLDLYKQKILEALPKERKPSTYNELPNGAIVSLDTDAQGHNQCLSEVKHIIENI